MKQEFVKNTVREAYENPQTVARYSGQQGLWRSEELLIKRFFPRGGDILDLGCGAGRTSIPLTLMGFHVVGMDLSLPMLKAARLETDTHGLKADFLQMDAMDLAFADESFAGAIFSFNEMDHMPGYEGKLEVLDQVFRVLQSGAPFIFSAHRIWSPVHLRALIWGGLKLYLGKILGFSTLEEEWGELYNLKAITPEERYSHFMSSRRWASAIRTARFDLIYHQSRAQLECTRLRRRIRRSLSSWNFALFVARKPNRLRE